MDGMDGMDGMEYGVWSMGLISLRAAEFVCVLSGFGLVLRSPLERRGVLKKEYPQMPY